MKPTLLLIAFALFLTACNKQAAPPAPVARAVLTQLVGEQAGRGSQEYSGEVRARDEAPLAFRIGGKLVERKVDAGERVRAGQELARLDAADANWQAGAAEAQFSQAQAEIKRYRELHAKGFVSQSALDAKEAAYKAAEAQAGLTRNQSNYTRITADHDGVIAATLAEAGQVVAAGQPVLRLARDGAREVAIAIPETQFGQRKLGEPVRVTLLADGAAFEGRLRELSQAADPASRSYAARVELAGDTSRLALGMTARVTFAADQGAGLLVPLTAIFQQGNQSAVWVVGADNALSLRTVQIEAWRDQGAVLKDGVAAGERIVSAGVHKLAAGEKVRIINNNGSAP
ncbi:MAG: efflux RND transporter periplasmic adaptor subunit [Gallionella sp.]|nr:efflux RND transporter periplasmic adaptor subunit [Gallionella sp.]MDD4946335.1 efflux RND transporter periplasmic adaptor subunit [Gallionella sp.]MDD5612118.1 efflux RND transporter periplasmic adaptor subunit [Gallionella sp.]